MVTIKSDCATIIGALAKCGVVSTILRRTFLRASPFNDFLRATFGAYNGVIQLQVLLERELAGSQGMVRADEAGKGVGEHHLLEEVVLFEIWKIADCKIDRAALQARRDIGRPAR